MPNYEASHIPATCALPSFVAIYPSYDLVPRFENSHVGVAFYMAPADARILAAMILVAANAADQSTADTTKP